MGSHNIRNYFRYLRMGNESYISEGGNYYLMVEEVLHRFNPWWYKPQKSPGIPRKKYLDAIDAAFDIYNLVVISGLRRVGKTTIMKQYLMKKIPEFGERNIFFASLDHPEIEHLSLMELLREFRRINGIPSDEPTLLLLDEVHLRTGFERELKALSDIEEHLNIVVSGSSSLVIRHQSAYLTGRYRNIKVYPLSFSEYLLFNGTKLMPHEPHLMEKAMEDYLLTGGMPQYILHNDPQILLDIIDDLIYKDIHARYRLNNPRLLKDMFFLLMERVGKPISYSKLARILDLGVDSVKRYLGYFEETFLVHIVEKYGKPNDRKYAPRKCYCADTGIQVVTCGVSNLGALAENLVFRELNKKNEVNYFRDGKIEVDFIIKKKAVEVKYKDKLDERDMSNIAGLKLRNISEKLIVTRRDLGRVDNIKSSSLWRYIE